MVSLTDFVGLVVVLELEAVVAVERLRDIAVAGPELPGPVVVLLVFQFGNHLLSDQVHSGGHLESKLRRIKI